MMELVKLQQIIEGALFAAGQPLNLDQLAKLFEGESAVNEVDIPSKELLKEVLTNLQNNYESRAIELKELASGFQFQVKTEFAPWVQKLWEERPARYSRALLETLALIAYRQPITRGEIEEIRGVAVSSHIMRTLTEREWVKVVGTRDVPGKPALYATTKNFLDHFGLKSLSELPTLLEIQNLEQIEDTLQKQMELLENGSKTQEGEDDNNKVEEANKLSEISLSQEIENIEVEAVTLEKINEKEAENENQEEHEPISNSPIFARLRQKALNDSEEVLEEEYVDEEELSP